MGCDSREVREILLDDALDAYRCRGMRRHRVEAHVIAHILEDRLFLILAKPIDCADELVVGGFYLAGVFSNVHDCKGFAKHLPNTM